MKRDFSRSAVTASPTAPATGRTGRLALALLAAILAALLIASSASAIELTETASFSEINGTGTGDLTDKTAAITAKQGELSAKQAEVSAKQGEIDAKQAEIDAAGDPEKPALEAERTDLEAERSALDVEAADLQTELSALETEGRTVSNVSFAPEAALGSGAKITGTGIPDAITITAVDSAAHTFTLSQPANATGTGVSLSATLTVEPAKVAVDEATGDVYVMDVGHDAIDRFHLNGTTWGFVSQIVGSETSAGTFAFDPFGFKDLAVDNSEGPNQGTVYIASYGLSALYAFKPDGAGYDKLWENTERNQCGVTVGSDGALWVANRNPEILQLDSADGTATGEILTTVFGSEPCEIAFSKSGSFYAAEYSGPLDKYAPDGEYEETLEPSPNITWDANTSLRSDDVFAVAAELGRHKLKQWDAAGAPLSSTEASSGLSFFGSLAFDGQNRRVVVGDYNFFSPGESLNKVRVFKVPTPPSAATQPASEVTTTTATFKGQVNPNGLPVTSCTIKYGLTTGYDKSVPCSPAPGEGSAEIEVSGSVSDLEPNKTYHFQLFAENSEGKAEGGDRTFKTAFAPPTVTTGSASGLTQTAAALAGTVNPNGVATTCEFEYGTSTAYGKSAPCATAPGSGTAGVSVSASLSGLSPSTTYHYRLVASGTGNVEGDDATFSTLADTCATNSALCPPPEPKTCANTPALCPVKPDNTAARQACIDKATKAYKKAKKAAAKKSGKAKSKALKAAKKRKAKALATCNTTYP